MEAVTLYRQEIDHNYRLLASPEGGRASHPLKQSYRYYLKTGSAEMRELAFLRSDPWPQNSDYLDEVHYLPTGGRWVGFGLSSGSPSSYEHEPWSSQTPEEKKAEEQRTSAYFIVVFSAEKLLLKTKVVTMMQRPGVEYREDMHSVRFRGPNGWMLYLVDENRIIQEPNSESSAARLP